MNERELLPAAATLSFENSTIEHVAVYLDDRGSQWLLGRVQPGRKAALRLPSGVLSSTGWAFTLVAIPLGTRKDGARGSQVPNAIRSELSPNEMLTSMRWVLRGHYLVGAIPLRGRH
jgi:hypothetical protein